MQTPDVPLNERGQRQAQQLAQRLLSEGLRAARLISSDHTRARMTAEPLARQWSMELEIVPDFQERNFGDLRGRPYVEVEAELGGSPFDEGYHPPGGESWEQFFVRVERAWQWLTASADELPVVVVTHGLVCHALAHRHLRLEAGSEPPERWGNTAITRVTAEEPWQVELLNCTAHLDGGVADDETSISGI